MTGATQRPAQRQTPSCSSPSAPPDLPSPRPPRPSTICRGCPVRSACLEWAIQTGADFGIWGGLAEDERRALQRRRRRTSRAATDSTHTGSRQGPQPSRPGCRHQPRPRPPSVEHIRCPRPRPGFRRIAQFRTREVASLSCAAGRPPGRHDDRRETIHAPTHTHGSTTPSERTGQSHERPRPHTVREPAPPPRRPTTSATDRQPLAAQEETR